MVWALTCASSGFLTPPSPRRGRASPCHTWPRVGFSAWGGNSRRCSVVSGGGQWITTILPPLWMDWTKFDANNSSVSKSATQFEKIFNFRIKSCIECEMVEFLPLIRNDESNSMFGRFQFAWWKLMGRGRAISALRNWNVKRLLQSGREQSSADGFVTVSNLKPHLPHWQQIRLQFDIFESLYFFYFCILNLESFCCFVF